MRKMISFKRTGQNLIQLQRLEGRRLLSAAVLNSILQITGTQEADTIEVTTDGSVTSVDVNHDTVTFDNSSFTKIEIDSGAGDDQVALTDAVSTPALIDGGEGNNVIQGGGGDDTLLAGTGDDAFDGGAGNDTLNYSARTSSLLKENALERVIATDAGESDSYSNIETLLCGSGDDLISVFNYNDSLRFIHGGGGNDSLSMGGPEATDEIAPTIHGGVGNDTIEIDRDRSDESGGVAFYYGDRGNDTFVMSRERTNRQFFGGRGTDTVDYSSVTTAGGLLVTLDNASGDGPFGDDNVHSDVEVVIGTIWDDTLAGNSHSETLMGLSGDDSLLGNGGNDQLIGGGGNDTLVGGVGKDAMSGGAGADVMFQGTLSAFIRAMAKAKQKHRSSASLIFS